MSNAPAQPEPFTLSDQARIAAGYLTPAATADLCRRGVSILDPYSTLVSSNVVLAEGTVLYPTVVIQCDADSQISIDSGTVLYPGTFFSAVRGGVIGVGARCEFGPGGVQVKANQLGAFIAIGDEARLADGAQVVGRSRLGIGAQVLGQVWAQSVTLADGLGGYAWPVADERGPVLKGFGLARGLELGRGQVVNLTPDFAAAPVESQSYYHPATTVPVED